MSYAWIFSKLRQFWYYPKKYLDAYRSSNISDIQWLDVNLHLFSWKLQFHFQLIVLISFHFQPGEIAGLASPIPEYTIHQRGQQYSIYKKIYSGTWENRTLRIPESCKYRTVCPVPKILLYFSVRNPWENRNPEKTENRTVVPAYLIYFNVKFTVKTGRSKIWRRGWPSLQIRSKWQRSHRNAKPNDLVLMQDENLPRGRWPLGVVT